MKHIKIRDIKKEVSRRDFMDKYVVSKVWNLLFEEVVHKCRRQMNVRLLIAEIMKETVKEHEAHQN